MKHYKILTFLCVLLLFSVQVSATRYVDWTARYGEINNGVFTPTATPVTDFDVIGYVCSNSGCSSVSGTIGSWSTSTDTVQTTFPTILQSIYGYGLYFYKPGYITWEHSLSLAGTCSCDPLSDTIYLTKGVDCIAPISDFDADVPTILGDSIDISADINSALDHHGPLAYVPSFLRNQYYSIDTDVMFQIKRVSDSAVLYTDTINALIEYSDSEPVYFSWTPTEYGCYKAILTTDVPDSKCLSSLEDEEEVIFCINECEYDSDCDDGLYCNGEEYCDLGTHTCEPGTPVDCSDSLYCTVNEHCDESSDSCVYEPRDCSAYDIFGIDTCYYNPDNVDVTWDYRAEFISVCDEDYDICTEGDDTIYHYCDIATCGAECEYNSDCDDTICEDGCVGNDWYEYDDVENTCEDCECTDNSCGAPTIYYNDSRCVECVEDDDCDYLDNDYCENNSVTHDEGICVDNVCEVETTTIDDCSEKNGIMNDCGELEWSCSEEINEVVCVIVNIDPEDELCEGYCYGDILNEGYCNATTYQCEYFEEDCNDYNGYYCSGTEIWYEDYTCESAECVIDESDFIEDCDNGLYCDGQEICENAECFDGEEVDCSDYDLSPIGTCNNNPDGNPFTWDYFPGYVSECVEDIGGYFCAEDAEEITHTCDVTGCGAECEIDENCGDTICEDGCVGNDWYEYDDVENTCEDCECTDNECGESTIYYNDSRCINECEYDSDCDDGLYCNGEEYCDEYYECQSGTPIDCSGNNLCPVGICNNIPDGNPFTWDYFSGFTSVCDEETDSCTTGTVEFTHTCSLFCGAECVINSDCDMGYGVCLSNCTCQYGTGPHNETEEQKLKLWLKIPRIMIGNDWFVDKEEDMVSRVHLSNPGDVDFDDVKVTIVIPELGIWKKASQKDIDTDEELLQIVTMEIGDVPSGEYDVRIVASNDKVRRVKHRVITIR